MDFSAGAASRKPSLLDLLFGRPLSSDEEQSERVGPGAGIGVFGLDALSSAAYGPEAALTILGAVGAAYIFPISVSIIVLLSIIYFSYRQTIAAYPGGGGSYTVASENLGTGPGLLAAAALMIDYVLDVAVGISAGVGALVSAVPRLQPRTLTLCLAILLILTVINLRGLREAGGVFMAPTYLFVGCLAGVVVVGLVKTLWHGGHPLPVLAPPRPLWPVETVGTWLVLKAFASGCTAMTGVEAVSNGVRAFREPAVRTARATLTIIVALLVLLLAGIAYLVRAYGIIATVPGQPGYQSVLSMLTLAVAGRGVFYYVTIASILAVLALSANTAFADFPRLCRAIAENGYLPYPLTLVGRRLVYTPGVITLVALSGFLLVLFGGVTDRLIPLFAVGAFLAFTLSQAGMVEHWRRKGKGRGAQLAMLINGFGALVTGITVCVVIAAKFSEGAWVTVLLIPGLMVLMVSIRRHYRHIEEETAEHSPIRLDLLRPPIAILPIQYWSRIAEKALRFAYALTQEIYAVHIESGQDNPEGLSESWDRLVAEPARQAGLTPPNLVVLKSPYRFVISPILEYVLELERQHPQRQIAVLVPELVERRWYHFALHNQRSNALKVLLYLKGNKRIFMVHVPWYLGDKTA